MSKHRVLGFKPYSVRINPGKGKERCRNGCGRPTVGLEIRRLIREMSIANPLWGAPRVHGELLKLGIEIGQTSFAKYMARRRGLRHKWLFFNCLLASRPLVP